MTWSLNQLLDPHLALCPTVSCTDCPMAGVKITALAAGEMEEGGEFLIVGSSTNLLGYHVEDNSDLFYKEVPDGVNKIVFGQIGTSPQPLALVGGYCRYVQEADLLLGRSDAEVGYD